MPLEAPNSYDELPYISYPYALTHPDWLATVGALFGMDPVAADRCRVLELGCASGGNLLPMAATLPESKFIGVDLSARQIAEGQAAVARAGLKNVELRQTSILDVDESYGLFDYVICYGVFSWVPRHVQDRILAICSRNLSPHGIAYVSYNTYPGGHLDEALREMMLFAARRSREPEAKMARARAMIDSLAEWETDVTVRPYVKAFAESLRRLPDALAYHDFLEDHNERFYFLDFLARATSANLQFLGEAKVAQMFGYRWAPEGFQAMLAETAPTLESREQYLDFFRNRAFRQTLLCRTGIPLRHDVSGRTLASLCFGGHFTTTMAPGAVRTTEPAVFKARDDSEVTTSSPIAKATLACLNEAWPGLVPCPVLAAAASERSGVPASIAEIGDRMWQLFTRGLVEIRSTPDRFRNQPPERPRATALARQQAMTDIDITNLRHLRVSPEVFSRRVLAELDGNSDRARIVSRLREGGEVEDALEARVEVALRELASAGLLLR